MAPPRFDADRLRFLELHETRVHALPNREIRDLGDVVVLHDPHDREPFWNRAVAVRWPDAAAAFDRRLAETLTLFATLDRIPHVWPSPMLHQPADLVRRLLAAGFRDQGGGYVMALDADRLPPPDARLPRGVSVERIDRVHGLARATAATDVALVLTESFGVEPDRRASIEAEALATFDDPSLHFVLARVDGEPAAVARRATFDAATYLSSIGTRPSFRGRGLAGVVTAAASRDGLADGSELTYLGVYAENVTARIVYERIGFDAVGDAAPDLILR